MKQILAVTAAISLAFGALAATETENQIPSPDKTTFLANATLEPYVTLGWEGVNGQGRGGAGANLVFDLTRGLSLWGFAESDNTAHSVFDRGGAGLRYTARLNKQLSLDAGIAGGFDFEREHIFARLPLGTTITLLRSKNLDAGLRVAYAFDITGGNAQHSNADGRLFAGPVATIKW